MIMMGLAACRWSARHRDRPVGRMAFDTHGTPPTAVGFVVVAMGVFGFAEIMRNLEAAAGIAATF